jgi:hypothetical protein
VCRSSDLLVLNNGKGKFLRNPRPRYVSLSLGIQEGHTALPLRMKMMICGLSKIQYRLARLMTIWADDHRRRGAKVSGWVRCGYFPDFQVVDPQSYVNWEVNVPKRPTSNPGFCCWRSGCSYKQSETLNGNCKNCVRVSILHTYDGRAIDFWMSVHEFEHWPGKPPSVANLIPLLQRK